MLFINFQIILRFCQDLKVVCSHFGFRSQILTMAELVLVGIRKG